MEFEEATRYLYSIVQEGDVHRLKFVLKEIQGDYGNASDYLLRRCNSVPELERFVREHPYLFMVENGKVARSTDELEAGRERADKYFEQVLKRCEGPVKIEDLRKHIGLAPDYVKDFLDAFYPETEFRRYLQRRPNLFFAPKKQGTVCLTERECVAYFRQALQAGGQGLSYGSLRGRVSQAPQHVMDYVNEKYPGAEFRYFLEENGHAFVLKPGGKVFLAG